MTEERRYQSDGCPDCCVVAYSYVDQDTADRRMVVHREMVHRPYPPAVPAVNRLREAANALADARMRYAREFGRLKLANPAMTDKAAMFAATESTNDEVTRLEAELEIARRTN